MVKTRITIIYGQQKALLLVLMMKNKVYIPVYIISLQQDIEKRKTIEKKLNELQINFQFIDAIYGKSLPESIISQNMYAGALALRGFKVTSGEVGCALSHLNVYEKMLRESIGWACILEDDVILEDSFLDFYKSATLNIDSFGKRNLYLLGGQDGLDDKFIVKSLLRSKKMGREKFIKTIRSSKYIYRTCCYLMNNQMAQEILSLAKKHFFLADDWHFFVQKKIIQSIYLADFVKHPLDLTNSTIEAERLEGQCQRPNLKKSKILSMLGCCKYLCRLIFLQIFRIF